MAAKPLPEQMADRIAQLRAVRDALKEAYRRAFGGREVSDDLKNKYEQSVAELKKAEHDARLLLCKYPRAEEVGK